MLYLAIFFTKSRRNKCENIYFSTWSQISRYKSAPKTESLWHCAILCCSKLGSGWDLHPNPMADLLRHDLAVYIHSEGCQSYRIPPTLYPALISKDYTSKHATRALYALNIVFQMLLLRIYARSAPMMTYINPVPVSCQNEASSLVVQWSAVFFSYTI